MSGQQMDVLTVLRTTSAGLHGVANGCSRQSNLSTPMRERADEFDAAVDKISALVEADLEYNAALAAHKELIRKITEQGWLEIEFDALRKAGERHAAAQIRRDRALNEIGGAA